MEVSSGVWLPRLLAALLGVCVGVVGTVFRLGAERGYAAWRDFLASAPATPLPGWLLGAVGAALAVVAAVWLTRRLSPEGAGSGIQEIEGVLAGTRPALRWARVLPVKFMGGLAALSAGLVLGREGPTIHMGGALAAAIAAGSGRAREHAALLMGAGSAAGLAVAFNAPLGGILFALEELRREFRMDSPRAQCVIIATVIATLVSVVLGGDIRILPIPIYAGPTLLEIALAVPFACGVGLYGVALNAAVVHSLDGARALNRRIGWVLPALGLGASIGALVFALPLATGGGELLSVALLESPFTLGSLLGLLLLRTLLFLWSYAGGTPGGLFAPQLAFGALLGLLFAGLAQETGLVLEPGRFAVVGMVALLTATVRAPLTGLALVIEMTGNFALLPMALVASVVADITAESLGSRPLYEVLLERTVRLSERSETG